MQSELMSSPPNVHSMMQQMQDDQKFVNGKRIELLDSLRLKIKIGFNISHLT